MSMVACPFRKLNPTVLMVKSAQDVASDDAAAARRRWASLQELQKDLTKVPDHELTGYLSPSQ